MNPMAIVRGLLRSLRDPLRRNSLLLLATYVVIALFGFFFWRIAEGRYGTEAVGSASALVSVVLLLHTLARLGLDIGLIRFLPNEADKPGMINTSLTIVGVFSAVLGLAFVLGVDYWIPALSSELGDWWHGLLFVVFAVVAGLVGLLRQGVFVAYRRAESSLLIEVMAGVRLPLLFALLSIGAFGVFVSWGLAGVTALVVGILLVMTMERKYRPVPRVRGRIVGDMVRFSLGNYVAETLREMPGFVLPIVVLRLFSDRLGDVAGKEMGAYFYIAWTVGSLITMVSYATGSSLLAESSLEPKSFRQNAARAGKFMLLLLVPAILLVFVLGDRVLMYFGRDYCDKALPLLRLLSLSGIPLAMNTIYVTQMRIQRRIWPVIGVYFFVALFTVGVGYSLMDRMELQGIGVAWLAGNCIVSLAIGLLMARSWLQKGGDKNQGSADTSTS